MTSVVERYQFRPSDLAGPRPEGLSAFIRVRNGAAFIEPTIRSHIDIFDEIVAVYNQCTDATPDILMRLAADYGPRLRVIHYLPEVFVIGGEGHRTEPPDSPRSMVTFSNLALASTRYATAVKLDDDHIALPGRTAALAQKVRDGAYRSGTMVCFSGLNLDIDEHGTLGLPQRELFSGSGDIGFFRVESGAHFAHDNRFEKFQRQGLKRVFAGFAYWHMKFLKPQHGFANYDLPHNPDSRFHRHFARVQRDRRVVSLADIANVLTARDRLYLAASRLGLPLPEKQKLAADRWRAALALSAADPTLTLPRPGELYAEPPADSNE